MKRSNQRQYICVFLLLAIIASGCEQRATTPVRTFTMGLIFWPPWRNEAEAEQLAPLGVGLTVEHSDHIVVQLPWSPHQHDSLPELANWMSGIARKHGKALTIAIDWQEPTRRGVLGGTAQPWRFDETSTQASYLEAAAETTRRYQPDNFILGVEVNYYARTQPTDFAAFVELYRTARSQIQAISPHTRVLVTFQYELLAGLDPGWPGRGDTSPIDAFGNDLDLLGIASYPHLTGMSADKYDINYLSLLDQYPRPWGIFETSWPTGASDAAQSVYLERLLRVCQTRRAQLLVWTATMDTADLPATTENNEEFVRAADWMRRLGLWTRTGEPKRAVAIWTNTHKPL